MAIHSGRQGRQDRRDAERDGREARLRGRGKAVPAEAPPDFAVPPDTPLPEAGTEGPVQEFAEEDEPQAPASGGVLTASVPPEQARERLDKALAALFPALSRTRLKELIGEGRVTLDGTAVTDPSVKPAAGVCAEVDVPAPVAARPEPENIPLDIVFEDADLVVLVKPAGMVVHPGAGVFTGTLVNALLAHCGASLSGIGGVVRPGIVHRLDKDTSGLMVVAKNDAAHRGLSAQFADHGREGPLERLYTAVCWGVPERTRYAIDAPIDRHPTHREKMAVRAGGREAVTHVEVEEAFGTVAALLACRLETGRTHQIRVHMAHTGHPLIGDETYATGFRTKLVHLPPQARAAAERLGRQALHAGVLGFAHPATGEALHFEAPPPADLATLIAAIRDNR
jgi:23S rRNA pseudouridine1911/1915/1917 synthase